MSELTQDGTEGKAYILYQKLMVGDSQSKMGLLTSIIDKTSDSST